MKWIFFLARKYEGARKRKGIGLVWNLAVTGVALGVATLLLTQSVLSGVGKVFRESILGFNAHLVVLKMGEMKDPLAEEKRVEGLYPKEIMASTPFFYREGLLAARGKVKGAVLKGIDPLTFDRVYDVKVRPLSETQVTAKINDLLKSSHEIPGVLLGVDLARELGVDKQGELVRVFLPGKGEEGVKRHPNFKPFRVVGTFTSGLREFDKGFALVEAKRLQEIYGSPGMATGLEFKLRDPEKAETLARGIKDALGPGYDAVSWQRLNGPLFQALRLERSVFFIIMSMVVAVAAFNIVGVLLLMIFDKTREISILRAIGSPYSGLKRLFGIQGFWIGILGCLWGLVLGGILAWILKVSKVLKVAKEVYLIGELPIRFSPTVLLTVIGVSLLITFLATQFGVARLKKAPLDL